MGPAVVGTATATWVRSDVVGVMDGFEVGRVWGTELSRWMVTSSRDSPWQTTAKDKKHPDTLSGGGGGEVVLDYVRLGTQRL